MDRNNVIGFILIFILVTAWAYLSSPTQEELAQQRQEQITRDSLAALAQSQPMGANLAPEIRPQLEALSTEQGIFGSDSVRNVPARTFEVLAGEVVYTMSTKGGGPSQITFTSYNRWDGSPVQILADTTASAYSFGFISTNNRNIETRSLTFQTEHNSNRYEILEGESRSFTFVADAGDGRKIEKIWTFTYGSYEVDLETRFIGLNQGYIVGNQVDLNFRSRLRFTEKDKTQEGLVTGAYLFAGGELEKLHLSEAGKDQLSASGKVDWVASRTKFFTQVIKPEQETVSTELIGTLTGPHDEAETIHHYTTSVSTYLGTENSLKYRLFVGPLKYENLKTFDEHAFDMVEMGYSWTTWFSDPLVRFIILPFFSTVVGWVGNFGIAIILFAFAVKAVLYPFTTMSYRSMAAMREVQPMMKEIQDKYKDNPQKQQEEVMKLYRREKVNPLGGCLPMLLQFPILITLWRFFQNTIQVRQQDFLWAADLSAPDFIIDFGFSLPLIGPGIGGFVTLMAAAMVVQSRVSGSGASAGTGVMAQQMKIMQYFFPIMLFVFFNQYASGLSLYYLVFNVLSIIQQVYINKQTHAKKEAEALAVPKSKRSKK